MMAINFDKAFGIHETALELRAERAGVIAGNLANADTPNYKAKDFDFKKALQAAVSGSESNHRLEKTDARHIDSLGDSPLNRMMYRLPMQPDTGDGNSVDAQAEQAKFAKNALEYQATLRILDGKIKGLLTAIKGE